MNNNDKNVCISGKNPMAESKDEKESRKLELIMLGLLMEKLTPSTVKISIEEIIADISKLKMPTLNHKFVRSMLDDTVKTHKWLGLARRDDEHLVALGGVHWYMSSLMYEKLVNRMYDYKDLTELFAKTVKNLDEKITQPRLLVDAGSTTYHCLFHEDCERLRDSVSLLITNNLFVAFRWRQEFKKGGPVILIGGAPDIPTGATVNHEKLDQWLRARSRQPQVSLLSWHYVVPDKDKVDIALYTKDAGEMGVKKKAMELTSNIIYVVFSADKIKEACPVGAMKYSIQELLKVQKSKYFDKKSGNATREVYLITDLNFTGSNGEVQKQLLTIMKNDEFCKNGIKLIYPETSANMVNLTEAL